LSISTPPELNLRAERAKPCGLKTSPEGASLSQRGVFSPARPAKWHILGQEGQLPGVLSSKILRNSNDALRGRKIIYEPYIEGGLIRVGDEEIGLGGDDHHDVEPVPPIIEGPAVVPGAKQGKEITVKGGLQQAVHFVHSQDDGTVAFGQDVVLHQNRSVCPVARASHATTSPPRPHRVAACGR